MVSGGVKYRAAYAANNSPFGFHYSTARGILESFDHLLENQLLPVIDCLPRMVPMLTNSHMLETASSAADVSPPASNVESSVFGLS